MPQTTRSSPRPAARFGRGTATTGTGRFSRPGTGPARQRRTPARTTARTTAPRFGRVTNRRSKQRKGVAGMLTGLLPTGAAAKATPGSKTGKAGGLAALAGVAGVAFRNRDKLTAMLNRKRSGGEQQAGPATGTAASGTPAAPRSDAVPPAGGI